MEERQLERWIKQYLDYITYERNFSPYTIEGRQKLLSFFLKFAGATPSSTNLIRDFLRFLAQERKWNPVSITDALTHIKVLTRHLYFTDFTREDYSYRIPRPKLKIPCDGHKKMVCDNTKRFILRQNLRSFVLQSIRVALILLITQSNTIRCMKRSRVDG